MSQVLRLYRRIRAATGTGKMRPVSWALIGAKYGLIPAMAVLVPCLWYFTVWEVGVWLAPLAAAVGVTFGAFGGILGGKVASAAGGNERDVRKFARNGGISWSAATAVGGTVALLINPLWGLALTVLIGPAFIFVDRLSQAWMEIFSRRTASVSMAIERLTLGWVIGFSFGWVIIMPIPVPNGSLGALLAVPTIGSFAGAVAAIDTSIRGASCRRAGLSAIEAATVASAVASAAIALVPVAPTAGIILATVAPTLWAIKRRRHVYPKRHR